MKKIIILPLLFITCALHAEVCCKAETSSSTASTCNKIVYDFSCMEMLRLSILEQVEKEGLEKNIVTKGIDELGNSIIEENIDELMKINTEEDADKAMMKLFKSKMENKTLREILKIK